MSETFAPAMCLYRQGFATVRTLPALDNAGAALYIPGAVEYSLIPAKGKKHMAEKMLLLASGLAAIALIFSPALTVQAGDPAAIQQQRNAQC